MTEASPPPGRPPVRWDDDVDDVLDGDLTTALAYVTPAGGAVPAVIAPCGLRDRDAGTVTFTTSLGFSRKLERILADPRVALAYHARDHGFATGSRFVLVQGIAGVDLDPDFARLRPLLPRIERHLGAPRRSRFWDRWLREYYADRVVVTVRVERVVSWPELDARGEAAVAGDPAPSDPPTAQDPPRGGTEPRVAVARLARRLERLPHRLLAYRQADGYPSVVPVALGRHDDHGLRLVVPPGLLPPGGRRAGLLGHAYRPQLIGLEAVTTTGWLEVAPDTGVAVYAPHTAKRYRAPANKTALLLKNGLLAKVGLRRARRQGVPEHLADLAAGSAAPAPGA